jgi:hypothetical protein
MIIERSSGILGTNIVDMLRLLTLVAHACVQETAGAKTEDVCDVGENISTVQSPIPPPKQTKFRFPKYARESKNSHYGANINEAVLC